VKLYYTGSAHFLAEDEVGTKKSFLDITKSAVDNRLLLKRVPLITRSFVQRAVNTEEELAALLKDIPAIAGTINPAGTPVLIVELSTEVNNAEERIRAAAQDNLVFWPRPFTLRLDLSAGQDLVEDSAGLEECLAACADPSTEEYAFVRDLLSRPTDQVLETWRKRYSVV
jgi:hypothetical protein